MLSHTTLKPYCFGIAIWYLFNSNAYAGITTQINTPPDMPLGVRYDSLKMSANGRYMAFFAQAETLEEGRYTSVLSHDNLSNRTKNIRWGSEDTFVNLIDTSADGRYIFYLSIYGGSGHGIGYAERSILYDGLKNTEQEVQYFGRESNISGNIRYFTEHISDTINIYDKLTGKDKIYDIKEKVYSTKIFDTSTDGRYIVFLSDASKLVPGDKNNSDDIFVYDQILNKTERINVSSNGRESNADQNWRDTTISISPNGRYVAFSSGASNLVNGDTNKKLDFFVRDRLLHKTELVSVSSEGKQGGDSGQTIPLVQISSDGRYVAFTSDASNLVTGDTNKSPDIFIHDRATHKTERVNISSSGKQMDSGSQDFSISADGRYVAFSSLAENHIFIRDRLLDTKHHADLTITPTRKPATLKPNTHGTYVYTITNRGKDTVPNVSLIHLVSGNSAAVSFKPSQGKCSFSPAETLCHLGKLATGKKLTLSVIIKVEAKTKAKALNQQITVSGEPLDVKPDNNQITVITAVK